MTRGLLSICAAAVLCCTGCRSEPVTWRTPLHDVVFLNDTLTWANLVPDTLWEDGDDGLVLSAGGELSLLDASSLIPNLDTSWSTSFTLPFIGGPIPVAPGAEIWSEEEVVNLDLPGVDLRRVRLGAGALVVTASTSVQGPLVLRYTIDDGAFPASVNGGSNEVILEVVPGVPSQFTLPLTGVELDLDGAENLEWSRLVTSWSVSVSEDATTEVGLFGNDMLELDVAFSGLEVAQVEGRFGHRMLDLGDTLDIEGVAALQDLQVGWTALEWEVVFHNTAGLDLLLQLEGLSRLDSGEVVVVTPLEDPALEAPIFLTRGVVNETTDMAHWEVSPSTSELVLGSGSSTLPSFLSSIPDAVIFDGAVEVNPLGDVSGGYDRIDLYRLPEIDWTVSAPLEVGVSNALIIDTLDFDVSEHIEFDGDVVLNIKNSLPVGAQLEASLVDVPLVLTLLEGTGGVAEWMSWPALTVAPGTGDPEGPVGSSFTFSLEPIQFTAMQLGARLAVRVQLETPPAGARFDADQGLVIQGHLDGDAVIMIE